MATFNLTTGANNFAGAGNDADTFTGPGGGIDTLDGGGGNDTFVIDDAQQGTIVGGTGDDTLRMTSNELNDNLTISGVETLIVEPASNLYARVAQLMSFSNISYGASTPTDFYLFLEGPAGTLDLTTRYTAPAILHIETNLMDGPINLIASNGSDVISAGSYAETLNGAGGNDTIFGAADNDTMNGGTGVDVLQGGTGNDHYYVDDAGDTVDENYFGGGDADRVFASTSYTLAATQGIEVLQTTLGSGVTAINLTGNEFAQSIYGNNGANIINGLGAADRMTGYAGDDRYFVDNAGDRVIEATGGGTDRILAAGSYALQAGQEVEVMQTTLGGGVSAINLIGNEFSQVLYGNNGVNVLNGLGGNDTMTGYGGNDDYFVDSTGDRIVEAAAGGNDRVLASSTFVLTSGQSVETMQTTLGSGVTALNLTGNEQSQAMYGNNGINTLNGLGGSDALIGYGDADTLNPGNDAVQDIIRWNNASETTSTGRDTIVGLDLNGEDKLDFPNLPTSVTSVTTGDLTAANFDNDIATAVNATLGVGGAVYFDPSSGDLNVPNRAYIVFDANNDGDYTGGVDYLIRLADHVGTLTSDDFM